MTALPEPSAVRESLPSGTVTFAFTDIEGSTLRWERDPAAMEDAVRRHDALVRSAIEAHGGHVFKTVGDAFCAAFSRPQDALAALLAAQREFASEDFAAVDGVRVRMALHTGTADERNGDYFGPVVNRVARLLAIGHGGQVLVSGATSDLVQDALPAQATLRDLGEHRLKDLTRPERVYQLIAPDLPGEFPPLRSLNALPNNLPAMLTSFVGRESEVDEITALLDKHRLVTLVGSGGIGKTRTSLQVAANLLDGSGDGVWFVELAPLTSGDYIPSTVAQMFGITLPSDGEPTDNLARALHMKHALLVFDNCEHLIEPAARVIAAILRGCPHVKVLASSRQSLGVAGEETYRLPTLAVPNEDDAKSMTASDLMQCAAVALFVERAHAADRRFALSDANAPIVVDICRRLDGIPLAIELAAARVNMLTPRQLRERLDERFRVLTSGSRDVLPRQQTLRALIDWSYDLLDERERTLFRRLGIFVNGFTLEGAAAVGSGDDLDEFDAFDVLSSLVDKSLVLGEPAGDALRYRLLESTRAYAREKLEAAGEGKRCAERHLQYLRERFMQIDERYEATGRRTEMNDALATERDDVRAALDFALGDDKVLIGAALLAATRGAWQSLGLEHEAMARAQAYLAALPEDEPCLAARLWSTVAFIFQGWGRSTSAIEAATQAVAGARTCGNTRTLREALRRYTWSAARLRRLDDAETALAQAEALPDASPAERLTLLEARATLSGLQGNPGGAVRAYEDLLKELRAHGDSSRVLVTTFNLAEWAHAAGETKRAIQLVRDVLPAVRASSDHNTLAMVMTNFAGYLAAVDEFFEASAIAREIIRELAAREPTATSIGIALEPLALALTSGGDLARAATLKGYADAAQRAQGYERDITEKTTHDRLMAVLAERLHPNDLARRLGEGAALAPEAAIALALKDP